IRRTERSGTRRQHPRSDLFDRAQHGRVTRAVLDDELRTDPVRIPLSHCATCDVVTDLRRVVPRTRLRLRGTTRRQSPSMACSARLVVGWLAGDEALDDAFLVALGLFDGES